MNKSKQYEKTCINCYHYIKPFKNEPNIPYCGINGLETKNENTCNQFKICHAINMYALGSCSECLDCQYFIKKFKHCNIGGIIIK